MNILNWSNYEQVRLDGVYVPSTWFEKQLKGRGIQINSDRDSRFSQSADVAPDVIAEILAEYRSETAAKEARVAFLATLPEVRRESVGRVAQIGEKFCELVIGRIIKVRRASSWDDENDTSCGSDYVSVVSLVDLAGALAKQG